MNEFQLTPASEVDLIDAALADLGTIVRRARVGTLTDDDFNALAGRMRSGLSRLRTSRLIADGGDEDGETIVLTDVGAAHARAGIAARQRAISRLLKTTPGLTTGRQTPAPRPDRMRTYAGPVIDGVLGVIDGGLTEGGRP